MGGDTKKRGIKRIELFEPTYIAAPNRIQITDAPAGLAYGEPFEVELDQPAANVERVALIRNDSVTHSTNNDQRYVGLVVISRSGNTLQLVAPPSADARPRRHAATAAGRRGRRSSRRTPRLTSARVSARGNCQR